MFNTRHGTNRLVIPLEIWIHHILVHVLEFHQPPPRIISQFQNLCLVCRDWNYCLQQIRFGNENDHCINSFWACLVIGTIKNEKDSHHLDEFHCYRVLKKSQDWRKLYLERTIPKHIQWMNGHDHHGHGIETAMDVVPSPLFTWNVNNIQNHEIPNWKAKIMKFSFEPYSSIGLLALMMKSLRNEHCTSLFQEGISQLLTQQMGCHNNFVTCQGLDVLKSYKRSITLTDDVFYSRNYPNHSKEQVIEKLNQQFVNMIVDMMEQCENNTVSNHHDNRYQNILECPHSKTEKFIISTEGLAIHNSTFEEFEEFENYIDEHCSLIVHYYFEVRDLFAFFMKSGRGFFMAMPIPVLDFQEDDD
ncbi:hypothetical protein C9374_010538 [Naegleria lovaniensis]|uniref:Uncharacterized protein n=1 Tax=Naegleria lovaniensis TaxID=51637 RepID=A0AA88KFU6_NAELO|nr:uncharacterized protein C9374_010538 [Naegleria lovaniensis]KAG2374794.1 hypothetical protein C9374_010538 [Naegleria lovaniensis]